MNAMLPSLEAEFCGISAFLCTDIDFLFSFLNIFRTWRCSIVAVIRLKRGTGKEGQWPKGVMLVTSVEDGNNFSLCGQACALETREKDLEAKDI